METPQRSRYQHRHFVHEYLRDKCLHAPFAALDDFYHEKATEHLKIAWVSLGLMYKDPEEEFIGHDGIEVVPFSIRDKYKGAIFTFPKPERLTEAFMSAIVAPADIQLGDRTSSYYTLEYNPDRENKTFIGQWAHEMHLNLGSGPVPTVENFIAAITALYPENPKPRINRLIISPRKRKG